MVQWTPKVYPNAQAKQHAACRYKKVVPHVPFCDARHPTTTTFESLATHTPAPLFFTKLHTDKPVTVELTTQHVPRARVCCSRWDKRNDLSVRKLHAA